MINYNIIYKLLFCLLVIVQQATGEIRHSDFIVVTPEKCGTHLLTTALSKLVNKQAHHWYVNYRSPDLVQQQIDDAKMTHRFLQMHSLPKQDLIDLLHQNNHKVIFLIRDPRDQMISLVHYIESGWAYGPKINGKRFGTLPFPQKLMEVITGKRYGLSALKDIMGRKLPWMRQGRDFVCVVRFENLVGEEGGGRRDLQLKEMRKLAEFLGLHYSDVELAQRAQGIFGPEGDATTFRKGQIGEWKKVFTQNHVMAFKDVFGKELIEMGYEKDFNWSY